jgi:hypothetical protein
VPRAAIIGRSTWAVMWHCLTVAGRIMERTLCAAWPESPGARVCRVADGFHTLAGASF